MAQEMMVCFLTASTCKRRVVSFFASNLSACFNSPLSAIELTGEAPAISFHRCGPINRVPRQQQRTPPCSSA